MEVNEQHDFKLSFQTRDQSMWSSGDAFIFDFSKQFLTPSFSTGSLQINPGPVEFGGVSVDPRFAFSATGQMGIEAGLLMNSGSVDATLDYDVNIHTPASINPGEFFKLNGTVAPNESSRLVTTSPTIQSYLDGIIKFSINDFYEAKVSGGNFVNGISNGTFTHQRDPSHGGPRINLDLQEELYGFNKYGLGRLVVHGADQGGVGDVISIGEPDPLATFTIGDWQIDATGEFSDSTHTIRALGGVDFLSATLDIDQLLARQAAPLFGFGVTIGLGPNIDLSVAYDILDYEVITSVGYQQLFNIDSSVSMILNFSENVLVKYADGNQFETNTISADDFDKLPEIALIGQSVEVIPEFMIEANLRNQTDIDFDSLLEFKVIAASLDLDFHSTFVDKKIYNKDLGPLRTFEQNILSEKIAVYDEVFDLGGFDRITGEKFILSADTPETPDTDHNTGSGNDSNPTVIFVLDIDLSDILSYAIDAESNTVSISTNNGEQLLENVKRIQLNDALFAFDTTAPTADSPGGKVWQAAALYHAGFGKIPDIDTLSQWVVQADQSENMAELGRQMIDHYAPGVSSFDFVAHLYRVMTKSMPTEDVVQSFVNQIGEDQIYKDQSDLFAAAASLSINANPVTESIGNIQQLDLIWF